MGRRLIACTHSARGWSCSTSSSTGPDRHDDAALAAAIARDPPVVLATHDRPDGVVPVPVGQGRMPLGSAAVDVDADAVLRRMLFAPVSLPKIAVRTGEFLTGRAVRPFG
jgi:CHASE2 domain-containing sensor protein